MTNLLPELIPLILSDRATSLALALVNKHYNDMVTPILYKQVTLESNEVIKAFSDTMVSGRPKLRQYTTYLCIIADWPEDSVWGGVHPEYLIPGLKQMLMHVPNLSHLALVVDEPINQYLIDEPRYPFKLRWLVMPPVRDAIFAEFLRTQPEIEHISLWRDPDLDDPSVDTTPIQPDILPKLGSIVSDKNSISIMVPLRPVSKVTLLGPHWSFEVHEKIAQSLVPLESLTECITFTNEPWESGVVSRCLPSLKFCWKSLSKYSLELEPHWGFHRRSLLSLLKDRDAPSHGLDSIRNSLSTFSALRNFTLTYYDRKYHNLTAEFCETVPELCRFDVWQESCPNLEEVTLFGITLKKA